MYGDLNVCTKYRTESYIIATLATQWWMVYLAYTITKDFLNTINALKANPVNLAHSLPVVYIDDAIPEHLASESCVENTSYNFHWPYES